MDDFIHRWWNPQGRHRKTSRWIGWQGRWRWFHSLCSLHWQIVRQSINHRTASAPFLLRKKKDSTKFNKISNSSTICAKSKGSIWNRLIFVILNIYDYIFLETPIYVIKQTKTAKITPNRNRTTSQKWLTIVTDSDLLLFSRFMREKLWEIKTFLFVKMFTQSAYVSFSF